MSSVVAMERHSIFGHILGCTARLSSSFLFACLLLGSFVPVVAGVFLEGGGGGVGGRSFFFLFPNTAFCDKRKTGCDCGDGSNDNSVMKLPFLSTPKEEFHS